MRPEAEGALRHNHQGERALLAELAYATHVPQLGQVRALRPVGWRPKD